MQRLVDPFLLISPVAPNPTNTNATSSQHGSISFGSHANSGELAAARFGSPCSGLLMGWRGSLGEEERKQNLVAGVTNHHTNIMEVGWGGV